jgi:hypothetical protein
MVELEALPEVQLILLYPEVDGVNLLLNGWHRQLHGTHALLDSWQSRHNLRIADIRRRWRCSLGRGSHTRYAYRNRKRQGHIIVIQIISP